MKFHLYKKIGMACLLPIIVSTAYASGSDSFGGGLTGEQQLYNVGKAVFAQKLACQNCAFAGKSLDKNLAQSLLNEADKTSNLSDDDRTALAAYLKLRFKL